MNSKTKSLSDFPSNILSKILNNKKTDISHYDLVECISYHIILDSCIHNYHEFVFFDSNVSILRENILLFASCELLKRQNLIYQYSIFGDSEVLNRFIAFLSDVTSFHGLEALRHRHSLQFKVVP